MNAAPPSTGLAANQLAAQGRIHEALTLLREAAAREDNDALLTLGAWSIEGRFLPRDLPAARSLYARAVHAGNRHAPTVYLAMLAQGIGGPRDWPAALATLASLAIRDDGAAADLALLEAMRLTSEGDPTALPATEPLSESPWVRRVPAFATPAECAHLAALARPMLQPSRVIDPRTGQAMLHPIRTSESAAIPPLIEPLLAHALNRRVAAIADTAPEQSEPLHVLRYRPGQQYRLHGDYLPGDGNQRILTAILYLGDEYTGGATAFPAAGLTVRGRQGDLLVFRNVDEAGRPDTASRHAGLPVETGEKMVATRWIRAAAPADHNAL